MSVIIPKAVLALIKHPTDPSLFLGVSRKNDHKDFGLPGGKQEGKETARDALSREVFEETGLVITHISPLFRRFNSHNNKKFLVCTYMVEVEHFNFSTTETGVVKWITKEELLSGSFGNYNKNLFDFMENNLI